LYILNTYTIRLQKENIKAIHKALFFCKGKIVIFLFCEPPKKIFHWLHLKSKQISVRKHIFRKPGPGFRKLRGFFGYKNMPSDASPVLLIKKWLLQDLCRVENPVLINFVIVSRNLSMDLSGRLRAQKRHWWAILSSMN